MTTIIPGAREMAERTLRKSKNAVTLSLSSPGSRQTRSMSLRPHRHLLPSSSSSSSSWITIQLLVIFFFTIFISDFVQAQPNFDECKIFLVASDTARDLSLNKDPEYIRFLNLVARTYLIQDDFTTYDELPILLQTTYKAYAWTESHEIDISAAEFGFSFSSASAHQQQEETRPTQDATDILRAFCEETSLVVAGMIPTEPPTAYPTVYSVPDETTNPTSALMDKDVLVNQDSQQTTTTTTTLVAQDDNNNNDITKTSAAVTAIVEEEESQEANLLPGPSDALSELPVECRRGMFGSDYDMDAMLNPEEYTAFVSRLMPSLYSSMGTTYALLPQQLKDNYERLVDEEGGMISIYGAVPAQWAQATSQQRSFLQLICYRTEDAIEAVAKAQAETAAGAGAAAIADGTTTTSATTDTATTTDATTSDTPPIIDIQLGHGPADHHPATETAAIATATTTSTPPTNAGTTVPPTVGGDTIGSAGVGGLGALSSIKTKAPITLPPLPSSSVGGNILLNHNSNNQTTSTDSSSSASDSSSSSTTVDDTTTTAATNATNDDSDSNPPPPPTDDDNNKKGMPTGNIIATVLGSILVVVLVVYVIRNDTNEQGLVPIKYIRSWINRNRDDDSGRRKSSRASKRKRRRSSVAPLKGEGKDHSNSPSERTGTKTETESRFYDLESSSDEEDIFGGDLEEGEETGTTGFLEDHRMGNNSTTNLLRGGSPSRGSQRMNFANNNEEEEKVEETAPAGPTAARSSSAYGFQTVRFNPDEFINAPQYATNSGGTSMRFNPEDFIEPPRVVDDIEAQTTGRQKVPGPKKVAPALSPDEERLINSDFQDYQYDHSGCNDDDDNSSAMSLYCNSVADEKPQHQDLQGEDSGSVVSLTKKKKEEQGRNLSTTTAETDLLTEFSSPRRNPKTMYHANRFEQIAQSESRSVKSESVGSRASSSVPSSARGGAGSQASSVRKKPRPKKKPPAGTTKQPPNKKVPKAPSNKAAGKTVRTGKPPAPPPPMPPGVDVSTEPKTPRAGNRKKIKKKPNGRRPSGSAPTNPATATRAKKKLTGPTSSSSSPTTTLEDDPAQPAMPIIPTQPDIMADEPDSPVDQFLRRAMDMSGTNTSASGSSSTGIFFMDEEEEEEENYGPDQGTNSSSNGSPQSLLSFSYGGRAYNIQEDGEVSPRLPTKPIRKRIPARSTEMHFTEITTGKQEGEDSEEESTSFLSDDFTDPGDEMLSYKKEAMPPPPRPPGANQSGSRQFPTRKRAAKANRGGSQNIQKGPKKAVHRTKVMDHGDEKPVMNDSSSQVFRRSSLDDESSINSGVGSSFLRDSNSTSCKDLVRGDSDSTYDETESKTSTSESTSPESTSASFASVQTPEGDPIQEIHRLVAIVMPSEQGKVTMMLDQYQGREVELAKTLRRLEIRMKARQLSGRPIHAAPAAAPAAANPTNDDDVRSARIRTIRQQAQERKRSSVTTENAVMIAAASSTTPDHVYSSSGRGSMMAAAAGDSESTARSHTTMFDLELSSSDEGIGDDLDEFSQDSTYFEEQGSSNTSFHGDDDDDDESLSIFSDLR